MLLKGDRFTEDEVVIELYALQSDGVIRLLEGNRMQLLSGTFRIFSCDARLPQFVPALLDAFRAQWHLSRSSDLAGSVSRQEPCASNLNVGQLLLNQNRIPAKPVTGSANGTRS